MSDDEMSMEQQVCVEKYLGEVESICRTLRKVLSGRHSGRKSLTHECLSDMSVAVNSASMEAGRFEDEDMRGVA